MVGGGDATADYNSDGRMRLSAKWLILSSCRTASGGEVLPAHS